jgi:hypothetical protein
MSRVFILSPANCGGRRAKQALSPNAQFPLAAALRSPSGAPLGDLFTFVSGLYFRGKLTYARRFAQPPDPGNPIVGGGIHVITPHGRAGAPRRASDALRPAFARGDIDIENASYRRPSNRARGPCWRKWSGTATSCRPGSIVSPKYVGVLTAISASVRRSTSLAAATCPGADCSCGTRATASSLVTCRSSVRSCTAHVRRSSLRSRARQDGRRAERQEGKARARRVDAILPSCYSAFLPCHIR